MLDSGGGRDPFGGRSRERRRRRLWFATPSAVCVVGAVILMSSIGGADVDQGNLWAIPALALVWTAVTIPAWRAGGGSRRFEGRARRLLRLHRRVHFRITILLVYAAFAMWWAASYAHFEGSDEYSRTNPAVDAAHFTTYGWWCIGLFAAAAVPMLVQPLTWRLWPAPVRMAVREDRWAARTARLNARMTGYPLR